ncbi:MAG: septum formation initiator family protein [Deltaproteobacteria bacterium]|nr:septum formation initiator family protein [Deltaproteobacteria bacterium]
MGLLTIFGERGLLRIYYLSRERDSIKAHNTSLKAENEALSEEIQRLKYDRRYIEAIARKELGMVGVNEIVYQFEE